MAGNSLAQQHNSGLDSMAWNPMVTHSTISGLQSEAHMQPNSSSRDRHDAILPSLVVIRQIPMVSASVNNIMSNRQDRRFYKVRDLLQKSVVDIMQSTLFQHLHICASRLRDATAPMVRNA